MRYQCVRREAPGHGGFTAVRAAGSIQFPHTTAERMMAVVCRKGSAGTMLNAADVLRRLGAPTLAVLALGLMASGCMGGVVVDDTTGHGLPGATVRYTDSKGVINRVLADSRGAYRFDQAAGVAPAAGPITIEVRAPGYQTFTTTRVVDYRDNPGATLSDLSTFWEIQNFALQPLPVVNGSDLEAADMMWLPPYHGSGELQLWVRNNGPRDVAGVSGRIDCTVEETQAATGVVKRFSPPPKTAPVNLAAGGATTYPTGVFTHSDTASYQVSCTITAATNDPDLPNNTFVEQIPVGA
jgi:carboxypeptidase family protein